MKIRAWIEKDVWAENYFEPEQLSDEFELFRSGVSYPLVTSLIDGCHGESTWKRGVAETPTSSLFLALKKLVVRCGASWFYITDPDNSLSIFEWEREIVPEYFNPYALEEFERKPAAEGGTSYMCIGFHDHSGLIVFELDDCFRICFYGSNERKLDLQRALSREELSD